MKLGTKMPVVIQTWWHKKICKMTAIFQWHHQKV